MSIRSFKDLAVWQQSMDLSVIVYQLTRSFPKEELFGLTSQIRRAASSIPANIAEGWGREGTREFVQFLRQAQGSLSELETHLMLATRLTLISQAAWTEISPNLDAISKMLYRLIRSLQQRAALQKR